MKEELFVIDWEIRLQGENVELMWERVLNEYFGLCLLEMTNIPLCNN
jgi:hypothetical protein